jgi:hypothetical protein
MQPHRVAVALPRRQERSNLILKLFDKLPAIGHSLSLQKKFC